jgi:hypothetical protein
MVLATQHRGKRKAILGLRDRFRAGRVGHPGTECVRSFEAPATHSCFPGGYCNDGLQRAPIRRRLTGGWPQPPGQPPVCHIRRVSRRFGLPAICRRFGLPAIRRRFAPADPDYVSLSSYRHSHVLSYLGLLFLGAL